MIHWTEMTPQSYPKPGELILAQVSVSGIDMKAGDFKLNQVNIDGHITNRVVLSGVLSYRPDGFGVERPWKFIAMDIERDNSDHSRGQGVKARAGLNLDLSAVRMWAPCPSVKGRSCSVYDHRNVRSILDSRAQYLDTSRVKDVLVVLTRERRDCESRMVYICAPLRGTDEVRGDNIRHAALMAGVALRLGLLPIFVHAFQQGLVDLFDGSSESALKYDLSLVDEIARNGGHLWVSETRSGGLSDGCAMEVERWNTTATESRHGYESVVLSWDDWEFLGNAVCG